jgi:hypothetical protein
MVYSSSAAAYVNLPSPQTLVGRFQDSKIPRFQDSKIPRIRKFILDILLTQC